MWVISKTCGIFNLNAIATIYEDGDYTVASNICGTSTVVSTSPVLDKIKNAIKHGIPFIDVE